MAVRPDRRELSRRLQRPRRRTASALAGGFTLLETLVGLVLFSLFATGLQALVLFDFTVGAMNANYSRAIALASEELENLRHLDYDQVTSGTAAEVVDGRTFSMTTAVAQDQPAPNMKNVVVTVDWTEPTGPKSYVVETTFTDVTR